MRETVGSLRGYFIIVALLMGVAALRALPTASGLTAGVDVLGIFIALAFGIAGVRLPSLLEQRPVLVTRLLWASMGYQAILIAMAAMAMTMTMEPSMWLLLVG